MAFHCTSHCRDTFCSDIADAVGDSEECIDGNLSRRIGVSIEKHMVAEGFRQSCTFEEEELKLKRPCIWTFTSGFTLLRE